MENKENKIYVLYIATPIHILYRDPHIIYIIETHTLYMYYIETPSPIYYIETPYTLRPNVDISSVNFAGIQKGEGPWVQPVCRICLDWRLEQLCHLPVCLSPSPRARQRHSYGEKVPEFYPSAEYVLIVDWSSSAIFLSVSHPFLERDRETDIESRF